MRCMKAQYVDKARLPNAVRSLVILMLSMASFFVAQRPGQAMPLFARKYDLPCARCHTMVPRLTNFGYAFYRAGYRLPRNEVKPYALEDMISLMGEFSFVNSNPGGDTGFNMDGVELSTAAAIDTKFAARILYHFATTAEQGSGFDEAWLQFNSAPKGPFWAVRGGQMPILSGYQLLGNRQITLTGPMFFDSAGPLAGDGQGNLAIGDLERGVNVTYGQKDLYGGVSLLNGINEAGEGAVSLQGRRAHDVVVSGEYLVGKEGTALQGFYYTGKTPLTSMSTDDKLSRFGILGTLGHNIGVRSQGIADLRFELNGAYMKGRDTIDAAGTKADCTGSLVEADVYWKFKTALAARYDSVRPSSIDTPTTRAYTFALTHRPSDLLRLGVEYRKQYRSEADSMIAHVWFYY